MKKYEYKSFDFSEPRGLENMVKELNQLGNEGWVVVSDYEGGAILMREVTTKQKNQLEAYRTALTIISRLTYGAGAIDLAIRTLDNEY